MFVELFEFVKYLFLRHYLGAVQGYRSGSPLHYIDQSSFYFNANQIVIDKRIPQNITLDLLVNSKAVTVSEWGCLDNSDPFSIGKNWVSKSKEELIGKGNFLAGISIGIDEHLSVSHSLYDHVPLIELLQSSPIDRIVSTKSECGKHKACESNTHDQFYSLLYDTAISSLPKEVPVYVLNKKGTKGSVEPLHYGKIPASSPSINVGNEICFEKLIKPVCIECVYPMVSQKSVKSFRSSLKSIVKERADNDPLTVLFTYSTGSSTTPAKKIKNVDMILDRMNNHFTQPRYIFSALDLATTTDLELIKKFAVNADIVIADHDSFLSHLLIMKERSCFIEIKSFHLSKEYEVVQRLSHTFQIYYQPINTTVVTKKSLDSYDIEDTEIHRMIAIVEQYGAFQHGNYRMPWEQKDFISENLKNHPGKVFLYTILACFCAFLSLQALLLAYIVTISIAYVCTALLSKWWKHFTNSMSKIFYKQE